MVSKLSAHWACLGLIAFSATASAQVRINTRSNLIGATLNQPYSNTLTPAGGKSPYTFTLTSGTPPTGITLSSAGVLSGTPTVAGPKTFSVKVTDSASASATKSFTLDVQPALQFVPFSTDSTAPLPSDSLSSPIQPALTLSLISGTVGQLYTSIPSFNIIGGSGPAVTSVISGQMPPGLRVGAAGDGLHGTPTTAGTYNFTLRAYDSEGRSATSAFTVVILPAAPLAITSPSSFGANVGSDFQQYLTASGGFVPYTWKADPAKLPQGLSLTAGGSLEGEPTNPTSYTFPVTVTDGSGATATQNVTFNVFTSEGLQITTTALTGAVQNAPYSDTIFVSGVVDSGTQFSITGGTLPSGQLSFSSGSGNLHGTVTAPPGDYSLTIQAVDYVFTTTKTLNLTVYGNALAITTLGDGTTPIPLAIARPDDFPLGVNDVNYTDPLSPTFELLSGSLPEGMTIGQSPINGAPVLSGTPNGAPGTYHAVIRARTFGGFAATKAVTFVVAAPTTLQLLPGLPDLVLGADYLFVGASGTPDIPVRSGDTRFPNYFQITAGALPPGIVLESFNNSQIPVGALVGTPTSAGTFSFTVTVTDAGGATQSQPYTIQVVPQLDPVTFTPTVLPEVLVGINYAQQVTAMGGGPPYTYTQTGGTLPTGYSVNTAGIVSGPQLTATSVGTYTFTVQALDNIAPVDGGPLTGTGQFTLRVVPAITTVTALPNAISGTPYSTAIQVSGGTPPYTFRQDLEPDSLPAGLTLNMNTGQITGTTTMVGSYQVGITIQDSAGSGIDQTFSLTVTAPTLSITTASLPDATMGANYNLTVGATGGVPPYTFSATNLPTGLAISSAGVISGICTTQASTPVTLKVIDSTSQRTSATAGPFTVGCNPAPVITNASPLPNGTPNVPYSVQFTTNAVFHAPGAAPFTWTVAPGGSLPAGFTLSPTGLLTGTATTATTAAFSIIFTDRWGASATKAFTLNFAGPVTLTSTSPLPGGRTGAPYSYTLTHSGGLAPFTFSPSGLPSWLTLNFSTGQLSGTPPSSGTYNFSITIFDSQSPASSDTKAYQLPVQGPSITTTSPLPPATIGVPFSYTLTATGGTPAYTWSGGELPSWITLSGAGVLSGTPPANAPSSFSVFATVTDSLGASASATLVLPIGAAPLTITSVSPLTPATVGVPYTTTLMASGGTPPLVFNAVGLPQWLTMTSAGVLSGTPPSAGPITFTLNVSDQADGFVTAMFTLPVNALLTIGTPTPLPPATVGMAYTANLMASGGTGGYTWTDTGLPAWLTLSSAGALTGTPPASGPVMFTATVTDSSSHTAARMYTLPVDASLVIGTATPLPAATVGNPYTTTFAASGGSGVYTWSASGLPAWLMLSATGVLTGTPPTSGPVSFAVTVTDSLQNTIAKNVTLPVNAALVIGGSATLPTATVGAVYSYNFSASGGTGGYVWSGSGLPAWLTLAPTGFLTGTPPAPGPVSFAVTVTDSSSAFVTRTVTLPVSAPLVIGNASPLPPGIVGVGYSVQFTGTGGSGSGYSWMASGLPVWLTLSPAGLLTGTPPSAGPVMFSVMLSDSAENTVTTIFTFSVFAPLMITTAPGLPPAAVGVPYSFQLAAAGGSGSYTWSGAGLPAWLGLSPAGLLTGTPPSAGQVTFTATVNGSVSQAFGIVVNAGLTITSISLNPGTVSVPYSAQLTASGGSGSYTWLATGLPTWLMLSPAGLLTGTPPSAGPVTFTATVNGSVSQILTLQVNAALTITTTSLNPATVGVPYSAQLTASGGSGSYTWSATSLPAWLSLSPAGLLTGTAPAAGPVMFTATVNGFVSQMLTLQVNAALTITTTSLNPATVGVPYSAQLTASGGSGSYTWSATGLPAWLSLSQAGLLTGTAPAAGPVTFTATVNGFVSQMLTLQVNAALTITTTSLNPATVGVPYSAQLTASGGSGTYTWSATGLPAWLSLSPAGLLTGTAPTAGPVTFTATVNGFVSQMLTLQVNAALTITTTSLNPATVGVPYSAQLTASGGSGSYAWSASGLPAWLTLSPAGLLTGTAPTAGPVTFTVTVNGSVSQILILQVNAALTISTSLNPATVGIAYSAQLTASGGSGTYTWSATSLPTWLTLSPAGLLTGTPPAPGPVTFTATVNGSVSQILTLQVNAALTISTSLNPATVGLPYSAQLTASGGSGTYTWSATGLPAWLTLSPAGLLTGTPPAAGPVTFTATVNGSVSQILTLQVNAALTISTSLNPATVGIAYSAQLSASGGSGTYTWSATGLPTWLTLSPAGLLTGTPPTAGPVTFTATVNGSVSQILTFQVNAGLTITTTSLNPATVGVPYSTQLTASGGSGTYTWSATGLPAWLTLSPAGLLTGTPPAAGPVTFTATVNGSVSQILTFQVNAGLTISTSLNPATVGIAYSAQLTASGGSGTYTWAATGLPAWLTLSPAGLLTGTPPAPGPVTFTATVNGSVSQPLTLPVNSALTIGTTTPLSPATVGMPYSLQFTASGGTGSYTWSASGLPTWLTLSPTGLCTGTPPTSGPVTFTATVNDSVSQAFTLPVNSALTIGTTTPLSPATVGMPYSLQFSASGGTGSYTWSASGLPTWLTLTSAGLLTGTPPTPGPVTFTATVNDSVSQAFTLPVNSALTIGTTTPLTPATVGMSYSLQFTASGGTGSYTWSASGLPSWLTLTPTGLCTGTPPTSGPVTFTATVNDSVSQAFTLPVNSALTIGTTTPLSPATVGMPYSLQFTASGGTGSYTWSVSGLPTWLTLTPTGLLTGTPPTSGPVTFTATVNDSVSQAFTLPVNAALTIGTTTPLSPATVGIPYSLQFTASGGTGSYTWSASGLPTWLTLTAAGLLTGTPPTSGPIAFTATVNGSVSHAFTLPVIAILTITSSLNPATVGVPYAAQLTASGGSGGYTWSATGLPVWLTLTSTGFVTGLPPSVGSVTFTATVNGTVSQPLTLQITGPPHGPLTILSATLPNGTVGQSYSVALYATGAMPPYTWSIASGGLPNGLALDSTTGGLTGTPTKAGTYNFSVQATGASQVSPAVGFSITVVQSSPLSITSPAQLPVGSVGTPYAQKLAATGGSGAYTWLLTGGALPTGLTLAADGTISGTPALAQTFSFGATVADSARNSAARQFQITISTAGFPSITTFNPLSDGVLAQSYQSSLSATGGTPPYTWSISRGNIPDGLNFDSTTGTFSGTPTKVSAYQFTAAVSDSNANSASRDYTLNVLDPATLRIVTNHLTDGLIGTPYALPFTASGGTPPYRWQLAAGPLPAGIALTADGNLSGLPSTPGVYPVTVQAVDTAGQTATASFGLNIADTATPQITGTLASGATGKAYSQSLSAVGGQAPYSWSLAAGALPPGLSLDPASGAITGTPSQKGAYSFSARVADSVQTSATRPFNVSVYSDDLSITPAPLPNGAAQVPYSSGCAVPGGTAPYNWSLTSGGLLSGLSMNASSGLINGTPTQTGAAHFTVTVTDSAFDRASQACDLTVQGTQLNIDTTQTNLETAVGNAFTQTISVSQGAKPLVFSVASGTLPPGLNLDSATGTISGTATSEGTYNFTIQVKDAAGSVAAKSFTIKVTAVPLQIVTASLTPATAGSPYSQQLQASGSLTGVTWSLSGSAPQGLSLDPASGILSGTPTAAGTFPISVQITDGAGNQASRLFQLQVGVPALPNLRLSGLPAKSNAGSQPTASLDLDAGYPLPLNVTAVMQIAPDLGGATDLAFANGSRTLVFTIPANAAHFDLPLNVGTLAGTIQLALTIQAAGASVTPSPAPTLTTVIDAAPPTISAVSVASTTGGFQVTITGWSTTRDMKTATFQFTPAGGAKLESSSATVDVTSIFMQWYQNPSSFASGSRFSLTVPFSVTGDPKSISALSVTLANSAGSSSAASASVQ